MSIIGKYLYGWDHLEPILVACIAKNQNLLMLGRHGCGKSDFMRFVSAAMSNGNLFKFTKYAMDKENLISMVGIPNGKALAEGRIEYATHQRSVFNADALLMDELTRALKDNQNLVLEILEEKTVFGMPLKYQFAIATANDETYKGAMKLDDALYDRFWAVIRVPTVGNANYGPEEFAEIMKLNLGGRDDLTEANRELREAVEAVREEYNNIWTKVDDKGQTYVKNNIIEFASKFLARVDGYMRKKNDKSKTDKQELSFRQIGQQFCRMIASVGAYFRAVKGDPEYLQTAALEVIKWSIATKYIIDIKQLIPFYDNLKTLLTDGDVLMAKVRVGLSEGSVKSRLDCLDKHSHIIKDRLKLDEKVSLIGNILQEVEGDDDQAGDLMRLHDILEQREICPQCLGSTKIKLVSYGLRSGVAKELLKW
ncbi:MAG: AAA family ATPase [Candidatus Hodarchaeales archaeon]|jgi:MoxR-like ATPase